MVATFGPLTFIILGNIVWLAVVLVRLARGWRPGRTAPDAARPTDREILSSSRVLCGYRKPWSRGQTYPTAELLVTGKALIVSGLLGTYHFNRADHATIRRLRRGPTLRRYGLSSDELSMVVTVSFRDSHKLERSLERLHWLRPQPQTGGTR